MGDRGVAVAGFTLFVVRPGDDQDGQGTGCNVACGNTVTEHARVDFYRGCDVAAPDVRLPRRN